MPQLIWVSNYEARNAVNVSIEKFDLMLAFSSSLLKYKVNKKRGSPTSGNQISLSRVINYLKDHYENQRVHNNTTTFRIVQKYHRIPSDGCP